MTRGPSVIGSDGARPTNRDRPDDLPDDPDANVGAPPSGPRARAHWRLDVLVAVSAGGAIGSLARYAITTAFPVTDGRFPASTLAINTSGSYLLGFALVLLIERLPPSRYARAFMAVGVIGAFTTFSTFAVDTVHLARDHHVATAVAFFATSVLGGLAVAQLGIVTGRAIPHRHPPPPQHPAEEPT